MSLPDMIMDSFYEHVENCSECQKDNEIFCDEGKRLFDAVSRLLIHEDEY